MQQQCGKITDDIEKYEKVASDFRKTGNPEFFRMVKKMICDVPSDEMTLYTGWVGSDCKIPTTEVIKPLRKIRDENCHL
ncbi:hypothetical protein ATZ36_15880 [Candidatus Endomicrobiellum trichonymphae]|uniref:Uncharacterized protein n=1 Tax=Endomicrobium trichonymphae TaxID=1408204 RepID=A0A1E5ILA6_ENDTX|nr:hypothetical protein ATZ36_15880 [Candidatus Endomicrobium trichonymphae]